MSTGMSRMVALISVTLAACGPPEDPRRSAVLITLDTTNPGALDVYGSSRGLTPAIANLAEEGVVFERAWSVAPLTLPAHASMLTGLYPPRHTVRDNGWLPLPSSADTVSERASLAGYQTAAFVAAAVLGAQYGLDQGFDVYEAPGGKTGEAGRVMELPGREITSRAVSWLDRRDPARPFFLWVHYFDPHAPYAPPERHLRAAKGKAYLGEVAALDETVGDLLARISAEPGSENTTILLVADHGEGLGRHGEATHGLLAYDSTLRVPLIVRPAGGRGSLLPRDPRTASVVDIAPTLLNAMGLGTSPESDMDGRDLLAPSGDPSRGVYIESYTGYFNYGWSTLCAWITGESKYVHGVDPELYDLGQDPTESHSLYRPEDPRVANARRAIQRMTDRSTLERTADESQVVAGSEDLGALGYGASASAEALVPDPLEPPDLPDPKSRLEEFARVDAALMAGNAGKKSQAIDALEEVVAGNPRHALAARTLSLYLVQAGRPREATAPLQGLLDRGLDGPIVRQRMAEALALLGEIDAAIGHLEAADLMRPGDPGTIELRERLLRLRDAGTDR